MKSLTQLVEIKKIKVPKGRRKTDKEKVEEIASSIKTSGLINPIAVDKDYNLVAGRHRYEAHELLGIDKIKATVYDGTADEMKLIEIDENLMRHEISFLERGDALVERQKVYEKIFPPTKAIAEKIASSSDTKKKIVPSNAPSFTEDTANKTGLSQRTIQQDIQLSKNLNEDIKDKVISGELEIGKNDLVQISTKDEDDQKKILNKIEKKDMPVKEAIQSVENKDKKAPKKEMTIKEFNKNLNTIWLKNITGEKARIWLMIGQKDDGSHVVMSDKSLTMKDIKNRIEDLPKK